MTVVLFGLASAYATTHDLQPGDDWCAVAAAAAPGDALRLAPGVYAGPCALTAAGAPGAPITIAGADPNDPAVIAYDGSASNVVDILASHWVLRSLAFGPTQPDIDAVKVKAGSDVTIEACRFAGVGGISVAANSADGDGLTVLGNTFVDLAATAVYIGCHDGRSACVQSDVRVANNTIDGVVSTGVGYGVEIKLDSWGEVVGNAIRRTQGPAVEIFGVADGAHRSVVEGNWLEGSETAGTLEIGGGPALVRNNRVVAGVGGGIVSYDYGGRGLVQGVRILGNTALGPNALSVTGWTAGRSLELRANATDDTLPSPVDGVPMDGNVACPEPDRCWTDAVGGDFGPTPDGALVDAGLASEEEGALAVDLCGAARTGAPDAGAWELGGPGSGPVSFDAFAASPCRRPVDTAAPSEEMANTGDGCACRGAPPAGGVGWGVVGAVAVGARRRRRGWGAQRPG